MNNNLLIIEANRVLSNANLGLNFEELAIHDLSIPFMFVSSLDLFVITDVKNDRFRIMKIRTNLDDRVRQDLNTINIILGQHFC